MIFVYFLAIIVVMIILYILVEKVIAPRLIDKEIKHIEDPDDQNKLLSLEDSGPTEEEFVDMLNEAQFRNVRFDISGRINDDEKSDD